MRRTLMLFFALLMLFAVSCSTTSSSSGQFFDEDFHPAGKTVDLEGFECTIRFYDHYVPEEGDLFGYKTNTSFNDAVQKRISDIETDFNCDIIPSNAAGADIEDAILITIASGERFYDIIMSSGWTLRPRIESGLFEPLSQVSDIINYLDSEKWGNWRLLEQSVWDGEIYGVVPVQWPGMAVTGGWMFAFNEKFAEALGQPDPREYIETDTWTRAKLGEMMLTYTTNDLGYPLKALLTFEGHFFDTALKANNVQTYKLVDGHYVSGYHTTEGFEALNWANEFLHTDYKDCVYKPCPDDSKRNAIFINEDVAMFLSHVTNIYGANSEIPFNVERYCVLPMPNGPNRASVTSEYTTAFERVHGNVFFPRNGDIWCSAQIANALFEHLDGYGEEELRDYYIRNYYHDERDYELAKEVFENSRYTFVSDNIRKNVIDPLYTAPRKSVTRALDSTKESQMELIEKYIVPTASSLAAIFGEEVLQEQ